jgi:hypothetical protein
VNRKEVKVVMNLLAVQKAGVIPSP